MFTEREEKASIAVASNAAFSECARTFTGPRLYAAIVDRLTFDAHIIETDTESYRLKTTRKTPGETHHCQHRLDHTACPRHVRRPRAGRRPR